MILARVAAALAALSFLSLAAHAQELRTVKIGVVNLSTDIAFYIAEKRGYLKAEGLKAEFAYFDSGAKMICRSAPAISMPAAARLQQVSTTRSIAASSFGSSPTRA